MVVLIVTFLIFTVLKPVGEWKLRSMKIAFYPSSEGDLQEPHFYNICLKQEQEFFCSFTFFLLLNKDAASGSGANIPRVFFWHAFVMSAKNHAFKNTYSQFYLVSLKHQQRELRFLCGLAEFPNLFAIKASIRYLVCFSCCNNSGQKQVGGWKKNFFYILNVKVTR